MIINARPIIGSARYLPINAKHQPDTYTSRYAPNATSADDAQRGLQKMGKSRQSNITG
jgi:hypothetical protein